MKRPTVEEYQARFMSASLTAPKFKGRAELIKLAKPSPLLLNLLSSYPSQHVQRMLGHEAIAPIAVDETLRALQALRVLEMSSEERARAIRRRTIPPRLVAIMSEQAAREMESLRHERKARGGTGQTALSMRPDLRKRALLMAFEKALKASGFDRMLYPGGSDALMEITILQPNRGRLVIDGVTGERHQYWSGGVWFTRGWARRVEYRSKTVMLIPRNVPETNLEWMVSEDFLAVPREKRWDGKYLWIHPRLRVSAVGKSLKVEQVQ